MKNKTILFKKICLFAILFWGITLPLYCQKTDAPKTATDRVELMYRNVTHTTDYSNGRTRTSFLSYPFIRVNGGDLQEVHKVNLTQPFKQCPSARKEWTAFNKTRKKPMKTILVSVGIAGVTGIGSLVAVASQEGKSGPGQKIALSVGTVGLFGVPIFGAVKARKQKKAADRHLENAILFYNERCYVQPLIDNVPSKEKQDTSTQGIKTQNPSLVNSNKTSSGIGTYEEPPLEYNMIRNDPEHTRWWTVSISPLDFDIQNNRLPSIHAGLAGEYLHGSKFGIKSSISLAYADNFGYSGISGYHGDPEKWKPLDGGKFASADYKRGLNFDVIASYEIKGNTKEKEDEVELGVEKMYGNGVYTVGKLKSNQRISWSGRIGGYLLRSVLQDESELLNVYFDDTSGILGAAAVMHRQAGLSLGIARRHVNDLKIDMLDSRFKGKKGGNSISELYGDLLFAPYLKLSDVTVYGYTGPDELPIYTLDATPLRRIGFRFGYRMTRLNKKTGKSLYLEAGIRPGLTKESSYGRLGGAFLFGGRPGAVD